MTSLCSWFYCGFYRPELSIPFCLENILL